MSYLRGTVRWGGSPRVALPAKLHVDAENEIAVARTMRSIRTDTPVVYIGGIGGGKTTLMAEVDLWTGLREPTTRLGSRQYWCDEPNWWTTAEAYLDDVRDGWKHASHFPDWGDAYSADGIAVQVKRLFLDDLGVEPDRDNAREIIGKLLRERHAAGLKTWITTNLSVEELGKRYSERVMSRMMESAVFVRVNGGDRRVALSKRFSAATVF